MKEAAAKEKWGPKLIVGAEVGRRQSPHNRAVPSWPGRRQWGSITLDGPTIENPLLPSVGGPPLLSCFDATFSYI